MPTLTDNITREEFVNWVQALEIHLNTFPAWVGSETLMEKMRSCDEEITMEKLAELVEEAR